MTPEQAALLKKARDSLRGAKLLAEDELYKAHSLQRKTARQMRKILHEHVRQTIAQLNSEQD
jgi:hypothetical protein